MSTGTDQTAAFEALLQYIRNNRGFDFTGYKRSSLERRINKRMRTVRVETYREYLDYLQVQPDEFIGLFNTILINVTSFFRDPESWDYLNEHVLPKTLADSPPDQQIRVWNPGCASGQESFTIAILLAEALGMDAFRQRVKIYATDVDEDALSEARLATYSANQVDCMPERFRETYLEPRDGQFTFRNELRRSIVIGRHDLVQDAPISRVDLLVCRNTLMYLNSDTQEQVLSRFHFSLKDDGTLFMGRGEMLLTHTNLFVPIELKRRVFRKVAIGNRCPDPEEMAAARPGSSLLDAAFDSNSIAQLVLDAGGNLAHANSLAREQFGIAWRELGQPFQDYHISYERTDLRSRVDEARALRRPVTHDDVRWTLANGEVRYLHVEVVPLLGSDDEITGVSITIADTSQARNLRAELERSRQDLDTAYEELESTVEEVETTNEELQSTNEELETMNEELQSTNEELETLNEELHSTNEELEAINTQVRVRTTELNDANAFLESIFSSLRAGVVVVDPDLEVRAWNGLSAELWGLRADEVVGGPFLGLDIGLPVEQLEGPISECLSAGAESSEVILPATNRVGKRIECKVTCMPLTGNDSRIRGAIMLMEALAASG